MAEGDFAWPVVSPHGPGYPLFLAALLALGSGSLKFAIACQAILGAFTATLIASIGRDRFGDRAGLFAGLAYALYAPAVYIDTALLSEGLLLFLLTLVLFALGRPKGLRYTAIAGLSSGLAILVRPTAIVFATVFLLPLIIRRAWTTVAVLVAVCAAVVLPAVAKSYASSHNLSIQGYGGVNVYIGDSPLHNGRASFRLGAGWDALNAEASRAGIADPVQQDRYYLSKALTEIRAQPAAFTKLLAAKVVWLAQSEEARDSHSFYFFTSQSPVLRVLPRWAMLFPLACIGVLVIARRKPRPPTSPLVLFTLAGTATTVLLVVGTRYRMPLVPVMAIAAGVAIDALADATRLRKTRDLTAFAGIGVAAIAISHVLHDHGNTNLAEEWAFTGSSLVSEHDLDGATAAYERALQLDRRSGLAWDGLGLAQYDAGRLADARESLARALAIDPANGRALFHLGLADEHDGKLAEAADRYRRAAELSPYDADVLQRLATVLGLAGRPAEARDAMRRSLELNPMNGEAWLDLCLLSLDLRDVAGASAALQRAEELGANPQKIAFASQALARAR
jgi:Flp pilus assembly protein TadD